jgi:hypothetical protein
MRAHLPASTHPDAVTAKFFIDQACLAAATRVGVRYRRATRWHWKENNWKARDDTKRYVTFRIFPLSDPHRTASGKLSHKRVANIPYDAFTTTRSVFRRHRSNAVCWHGHRDFFLALFSILPDLVVRSAVATYRGEADFLKNHPKSCSAVFLDGRGCNCKS